MSIVYTTARPELVAFHPPAARVILDVGCSTGAFGASLRRQGRAPVRIVGMEPNPAAAREADQVYDEVVRGAFPEDRDALPRGESYDVVYFNDVLEHMVEPDSALRAACDLLSAQGVVIASIPNIRHISALGPLLLLGEFRYTPSGILDATHLRFYTERTIWRLFLDAGYHVDRVEGINRTLRLGDTRTRPWIRLLSLLTRGRSDAFFFAQYVVVARPRVLDAMVRTHG